MTTNLDQMQQTTEPRRRNYDTGQVSSSRAVEVILSMPLACQIHGGRVKRARCG